MKKYHNKLNSSWQHLTKKSMIVGWWMSKVFFTKWSCEELSLGNMKNKHPPVFQANFHCIIQYVKDREEKSSWSLATCNREWRNLKQKKVNMERKGYLFFFQVFLTIFVEKPRTNEFTAYVQCSGYCTWSSSYRNTDKK